MAVTKGATDKFANQAIITVTESAANTLTFKKLETGISISEKIAWVLNRLEILYNALDSSIWNSSGDSLLVGLSVSNTFSAPYLYESTILTYDTATRSDLGTAASGFFINQKIVNDYSSLPGGGIIVPPSPLYAWAKGAGLASATTTYFRLWYTTLELSVDQYWELVEARRVLSS